jgi:GAF domain-containing protein
LVTGGLKVRFYAGAPLISPEGIKLGTLCPHTTATKVSTKAQQLDDWSEMAEEVVYNMISVW